MANIKINRRSDYTLPVALTGRPEFFHSIHFYIRCCITEATQKEKAVNVRVLERGRGREKERKGKKCPVSSMSKINMNWFKISSIMMRPFITL